MSFNLEDYLSTPMKDQPKPVVLPDGWYNFVINQYTVDKVGKDGTGLLKIFVKPTDILESELPEEQLSMAKRAKFEMWLTENAVNVDNPAWSLNRFIDDVLCLPEENGPGDNMELMIGMQFAGRTKIEMEGKNKDIPMAVMQTVKAVGAPF